MAKYKDRKTFEERKEKHFRIMNANPNKVPIVVETNNKELKRAESIYMIDVKSNIAKLITILKGRIGNISPDTSLFIFIDNKIYPPTDSIGDIYNICADYDSALYCELCAESVFG